MEEKLGADGVQLGIGTGQKGFVVSLLGSKYRA